MDWAALIAEIALPEHAGRSDAEITAALNAPAIDRPRLVAPAEITRVLQLGDEWPDIVIWGRRVMLTPESAPEHFAKVKAAVRIIEAMDRRTDFNLADPASLAAIQGGLAALKAAGLLGDATIATIVALGTTRISRAAQLGWASGLKAEDIDYARRLQAERAAGAK